MKAKIVISKLFQRASKLLYFLALVLLPTQLTYHIWPNWAYVSGIRIDYYATRIFFVDIVIFFLLLLYFSSKKNLANLFILLLKFKFELILILLISALNLAVSNYFYLTLLALLKLYLLIIFGSFIYLSFNAFKSLITNALIINLIFTFLLGSAQIINKGSLNNIFYLLGERNFNITTYGISLMRIFDNVLVRPYATFPHPNALAGYSLIAFLLILALSKNKIIKSVSFIAFSIILIISFSQNAWLVSFIILLIYKFNKYFRTKYIFYLLITLICFSFLLAAYSQNLLKIDLLNGMEFVEKRLRLFSIAIKLFSDNYLLGIGVSNFIHTLPSRRYYFLQPVHNVYIQLVVEMGMVIILPIMLFAKRLFLENKALNIYLSLAWIAVFLLSVFDHYFLTIHQTRGLLIALIAVSLAHESDSTL